MSNLSAVRISLRAAAPASSTAPPNTRMLMAELPHWQLPNDKMRPTEAVSISRVGTGADFVCFSRGPFGMKGMPGLTLVELEASTAGWAAQATSEIR